jgi:hypothetical protein
MTDEETRLWCLKQAVQDPTAKYFTDILRIASRYNLFVKSPEYAAGWLRSAQRDETMTDAAAMGVCAETKDT